MTGARLIIEPFGLINEEGYPVGSQTTIMLKGGPKFPQEMTGPHQVIVKEWDPSTTEGLMPTRCVTLSFSKEDHYLKNDTIALYRIALVSVIDPSEDYEIDLMYG